MPWYHTLGWRANPFDYRPSADFFVFERLAAEVSKHVESNAVVSTYGIAGIGKTSLLYYLDATLSKSKYATVFFDFREITSKDEFLTVLKQRLAAEGGFFWRISELLVGSNKGITDKINSIIGKKTLVLLIDEAGLLKSEDVASLLATIKDRTHSSIVSTSIEPLSAYEIYKGSFREGRVSREIPFPLPLREDLKNMVRERIESVGGSGTYPFADEALDYIAKISGNIPREVLINCQNAAMYYVDEKYDRELGKADLEILLTGKPVAEHGDEDIDWVYRNLSDNQQMIIKALLKPKTAQELEKELGISYGSLTKELGRLMLQTDVDMMFRKGLRNPVCTKTLDRPHKYVLTKKWRLLFTKE
ncbi:MAG: ATP-binding protein [Candidatus Micrarchaeia archaeon]